MADAAGPRSDRGVRADTAASGRCVGHGVCEPDGDHDRRDHPQRRAPDAGHGAQRRHQRSAMVRQRLRVGLRRPAAHGRRAGRPFRSPPHPGNQAAGVRRCLGGVRRIQFDQRADRGTSSDGLGRRTGPSRHVGDRDRRLHRDRGAPRHRGLGGRRPHSASGSVRWSEAGCSSTSIGVRYSWSTFPW